MRTGQRTCSESRETSSAAACSDWRMADTRSKKSCPRGVMAMGFWLRSKSVTPSSCSSCWTALVMDGWDTERFCAALVKLRVRPSSKKYSNCRSSIAAPFLWRFQSVCSEGIRGIGSRRYPRWSSR